MGSTSNDTVTTDLAVFDGAIFIAVDPQPPGSWANISGGWTQESNNIMATVGPVIDRNLLVDIRNPNTGLELWSYDGSSWIRLEGGGFGNTHNETSLLFGLGDHLYAMTDKFRALAFELWRCPNDDPVGDLALGCGARAARLRRFR